MKETMDVLVRNIPKDLVKKITKQSNDNFRSRNNEIIAILKKGVK